MVSTARSDARLAFGTGVAHDVAADDLARRLVIRGRPASPGLFALVPAVHIGAAVVLVHLRLLIPHLPERGAAILPHLGLSLPGSPCAWHQCLLTAGRCLIP